MKQYIRLIYIFAGIVGFSSCLSEEEWLDVKSRKSDVKPTTAADFQSLLDNDLIMNQAYPALGTISADNLVVTYNAWLTAFYETERNAYTWADQLHVEDNYTDWGNPYKMVSYANVVLEGIEALDGNEETARLKGAALFYRSHAFYNLVQSFAKPYNSSSATTDLGIPLRLSTDVNATLSRSTLEQTYDQIINDLIEAEGLLPATVEYNTRPSKAASNALLARTYLHIGDYEKVLSYSNKALETQSTLIDFNGMTDGSNPFPRFPNNQEVIFYSELTLYWLTYTPFYQVNPELYALYEEDDLRKNLFYNVQGDGQIKFTGQYTGRNNNFGGIGINEIYLMKAEAQARLGKTAEAMATLNQLLEKRYVAESFTPLSASTSDEALEIILLERRKELPFTSNLRWEDLKRLNKESKFSTTLTRELNGITYTLPPNDPRYIFDIPQQEIDKSGLQQNKRN